MIDESKNVQTTPTRTYYKRSRPLPYCNPNCRTPRHWKFTQHHRTTRPPHFYHRKMLKRLLVYKSVIKKLCLSGVFSSLMMVCGTVSAVLVLETTGLMQHGHINRYFSGLPYGCNWFVSGLRAVVNAAKIMCLVWFWDRSRPGPEVKNFFHEI